MPASSGCTSWRARRGRQKTRATLNPPSPRRASRDRYAYRDAKKKHDAYSAYSASPPSSPSSLLGVRTSPRSELGPNLGPTSPGSPLAAARGTAANGASSSVSVDEPTETNRDPSRTRGDFVDFDDSVFLIAVADATAPSGRRKLAVVTPAPPFPRASASRDVVCRMDFFDGDDAETSETSETSTATKATRRRMKSVARATTSTSTSMKNVRLKSH